MNNIKIKMTLIIVLLLPIYLCGCWNKTDLNDRSIISGIGIDRNDEKIELTIQTIVSEEVTAGEGSSKNGSSPKDIVLTSGETVFDAVRNFTLNSGKKGMWSHCEVIIIGSDCAKKGINEVLDFLSRDHEVRFRTWVLISKKTARDILSSNVIFEDNVSFGISELLKSSDSTSYVHSVDLLHLGEHLLNQDGVALLPVIDIDKKNNALILDGSAIIKNYKLIDWLDKTLTRGYLWISGDVKSGVVNVEMDETKHGIEIMSYDKKIKVSFDNNIPIINITLNVKASMGDVDDLIGHITSEYLTSLENETAKVIKNEVESVIDKAQNISTDFLGFSSLVNRKNHNKWKNIRNDWNLIFPEVKTKVEVNVNIFKTGLKS